MEKQQLNQKLTRWALILLGLGLLALFIYSFQSVIDLEKMDNPVRQMAMTRIFGQLVRPSFQDNDIVSLVALDMWETFQVGFLATVISAFLAIPFAFLSARTASPWGRIVNLILQPILSIVRSIHPLWLTLPAIMISGMGTTAGVLALTWFSTAGLIRVFSEVARQNRSLNWIALLKAPIPVLALRQLPVNLLIASTLGMMGAGGIGFFIMQSLNLLYYNDVSVAILACILVIGTLDLIGRAAWHRVDPSSRRS